MYLSLNTVSHVPKYNLDNIALHIIICIQRGINFVGNQNAKQKHPRCKESEAKSEAPVSSYSYMRLKSVISGGGQGPSCLLATRYGQLHIN